MSATPDWQPDILGEGYEQTTLDLGPDPDGEGDVAAVVVRRTAPTAVEGAVLYVHGFSDYFFQTDLADFMAERGQAFYALDHRKSGRARRPGQTAHYVSDLALYDDELDRALAIIAAEHPAAPVTVVAHSTGGLIVPLWLDRRRSAGRIAPVAALVLNSPWFDLQGSAMMRGPITQVMRGLARVAPQRVVAPLSDLYGSSVHVSGTGEWDYDTVLKPVSGFPVTAGWLNAVRRGHARLHLGLDVGVPSLVLRSDKTWYAKTHTEASDRADVVLDVRQIARWAGCLGGRTSVVPITDARHDVFLSLPDVRAEAYRELSHWLDETFA